MTVKSTTNYTELTNLTVFTEYVVNVSAVSSGGVGPGISTTVRTDVDGRFYKLRQEITTVQLAVLNFIGQYSLRLLPLFNLS